WRGNYKHLRIGEIQRSFRANRRKASLRTAHGPKGRHNGMAKDNIPFLKGSELDPTRNLSHASIEDLISINSPHLPEALAIGRVLGQYTQGNYGPALVVTAGVHGNEPSGIIAFDRVLQRLKRLNLPMQGELTGLAGNMAAL